MKLLDFANQSVVKNQSESKLIRTRTTQYINFMWFDSVPTFTGTVSQNSTITEIGFHRRVFIITLDMTKL